MDIVNSCPASCSHAWCFAIPQIGTTQRSKFNFTSPHLIGQISLHVAHRPRQLPRANDVCSHRIEWHARHRKRPP